MTDKKKIAIAMSGGVDSSVTAALLQDAGHELIGMTISLIDEANSCNNSVVMFDSPSIRIGVLVRSTDECSEKLSNG